MVEAVVLEYLLPLPNRVEEVGTWTDRFVFVYSSLSDAAQQSLLRLTHFAERRPSPYARYITACEENNVSFLLDQLVHRLKLKLRRTGWYY